MKCDELKAVESATAVIENVHLVYRKSEVDSAIDELKREHHRERHEYIDMVAQLKAKLVEQESENRRLQRALWLARAEKNELLSNYRELDNYMYGLMVAGKRSHYEDYENHADSYNEWTTKLSNAAKVCRAKTEEYK